MAVRGLLQASTGKCHGELDAPCPHLLHHDAHKLVFLVDEEGGETVVVVVPAPSAAVTQRVFHREVGHEHPVDTVDAIPAYRVGHHPEVVAGDGGVEAAYKVEVAQQGVAFKVSAVADARVILVVAAQHVERGNRRDEFHHRGRTHALPLVLLIHHLVGGEVVDEQAQLGVLQQTVVHHVVEPASHLVEPEVVGCRQGQLHGGLTDGLWVGDDDVLCHGNPCQSQQEACQETIGLSHMVVVVFLFRR